MSIITDLPRGRLIKLGKKDVPLRVDTKNSEFTGQKDIWQNSQDKVKTSKNNSATVLNQLWLGKR